MGGGLLLWVQNACDLAQTSKHADHVRSVPVLAESALPRRKRVHFLWGCTASRIANGAFRDRRSSSSDRSFYPPRRRTTRGTVRRGLAELQEARAPMALNAAS